MSKGQVSKEFIVQTAMPVFNVKGYNGTSMQNIIEETGFQKGGIYRHFSSKEELAIASFKYAYQQMRNAYLSSYARADEPDVKLEKFLSNMKKFLSKPPVKGGCPILNTAVDVDDTNEPLRKVVQEAANEWEMFMTSIFEDGKKKKIFNKTIDPVKEAHFFIAAIEGAIMFTKLHRNINYGLNTVEVLEERIAYLKV